MWSFFQIKTNWRIVNKTNFGFKMQHAGIHIWIHCSTSSLIRISSSLFVLYLKDWSHSIIIHMIKIKSLERNDDQIYRKFQAQPAGISTCIHSYCILLPLSFLLSIYFVIERMITEHHYLHNKDRESPKKWWLRLFQFSSTSCWSWYFESRLHIFLSFTFLVSSCFVL